MRRHISLVLIDDNPSVRQGVAACIRAQSDLRLLAASANTKTALRQVRETRPDIVLLGLRREADHSVELAGALHAQAPDCRVIILGVETLQEHLMSLIRAGVSGFIMVNASFDKVLSTVYSVAHGIRVLPKELTHSLFAELNAYRVQTLARRV